MLLREFLYDEMSLSPYQMPGVEDDVNIIGTALTEALERKDFNAAEKIIEDNVATSYLNEGPFEKFPLALVLSGDIGYYHLRLAAQLLMSGANPNMDLGHRWSSSAMEYAFSLYVNTRAICKLSEEEVRRMDFDNSKVIGLHGEENLSQLELKEQLLELMDLLIECGGNPNVTTSTCGATVLHLAVTEVDPDIDLILKLLDAGGNLNNPNVHGTTPLMDLVGHADQDFVLQILRKLDSSGSEILLDMTNCTCETALWRAMLAGSSRVAIELLSRGADPSISSVIIQGTLNRCIHVERRLITPLFAPLLQNSSPYIHLTRTINFPLKCELSFMNNVMSSCIYPVVDNTYLSESFPEGVLDDLRSLLFNETNFTLEELISAQMQPQDVAVLMFSNLKAGLQQLCVRRILHQVILTSCVRTARYRDSVVFGVKKMGNLRVQQFDASEVTTGSDVGTEEKADAKQEAAAEDTESEIKNWDGEANGTNVDDNGADFVKSSGWEDNVCTSADNLNEDDEYCGAGLSDVSFLSFVPCQLVQRLNMSNVNVLVTKDLNLPPLLVKRFSVEAARLQIGVKLFNMESASCLEGCDIESNGCWPFQCVLPVEEDEEYDDDDFDFDSDATYCDID